MVTFTTEQLREAMNNPENIRNVTIIAHIKHGKTTISEALVAKTGIIANKTPDDAKSTKTPEDVKEQDISIKTIDNSVKSVGNSFRSTSNSLYYEHNTTEKGKNDPYFINLIDSPGHSDFLSEVTAALRITDGALVIVDSVEGVCLGTESVLRGAMAEKIRPVLMINKVDRLIFELQTDVEEMYQNFSRTIDLCNVIVATYEQPDMGDAQIFPSKGNVAFGSGKDGWAFTIPTFARIYASKFGIDLERMKEKLWGDHFFSPNAKKWVTSSAGEGGESLKRGFCAFIMEPIITLSRSIMEGKMDQMDKILSSLQIKLSSEERERKGNDLLKLIMSKWMNVADSLLEMMVLHLPSPRVAQKYRVSDLYDGPQDDEIAASIRDCNPKGPLIMYVSKMIPNTQKGRFFAFGRVFGGTISTGQKVRVLGPEYVPGRKTDLFIDKAIQGAALLLGNTVKFIAEVPCGNLVGLVGVDQYLMKAGTITDSESSRVVRPAKLSVSPVYRVAVDIKNSADFPKLIEGLRKLSKSDPLVHAYTELSGQSIIAGSSELHIEVCLNDLQKEYTNCEIKASEPFIVYKETVTAVSNQFCLAKSPNKHNRICASAEPLDGGLVDLIETGKLGPKSDSKTKEQILCDDYGWDKIEVSSLWAFGPDNKGANILVDVTKGVPLINEIKDFVDSAFQWCTMESVMIEENMRSVKMNLADAILHTDAIHRGGGQIIPACRRALYAAVLTAEPRIQEPIYIVEIISPTEVMNGVYQCLNQRKGVIIEEDPILGSALIKVKAYLPIAESVGKIIA